MFGADADADPDAAGDAGRSLAASRRLPRHHV
jgi:hypothetical protein